jgi:hypothetical protein
MLKLIAVAMTAVAAALIIEAIASPAASPDAICAACG